MQITGHTRLGGLLGSPVAHSLSPMMHNDAFQALDIDYVYLCFETPPEELKDAVRALKQMNAYGFNCTMPHKTAIMEFLDEVSPEARLIGACNTVLIEDGRLKGYNTDGIGFMQSARMNGIDVKGKEVVLLGAGGAASAIAVQAAMDGASHLHLVCRRSKSWSHALSLSESISKHTACQADLTDISDIAGVQELLNRAVLLINGTSVGMLPHPDNCPLSEELSFPETLAVGDVIYHPQETLLMKRAASAGCRTFNGMYMLLYQGAACFQIWTGKEMPVDMIRERYFS